MGSWALKVRLGGRSQQEEAHLSHPQEVGRDCLGTQSQSLEQGPVIAMGLWG